MYTHPHLARGLVEARLHDLRAVAPRRPTRSARESLTALWARAIRVLRPSTRPESRTAVATGACGPMGCVA